MRIVEIKNVVPMEQTNNLKDSSEISIQNYQPIPISFPTSFRHSLAKTRASISKTVPPSLTPPSAAPVFGLDFVAASATVDVDEGT